MMARLAIFLWTLFLASQETLCLGSIYEPLANHLLSRTKSRLIPITEEGKKVHVVVQVGVQSIERIDREKNQVELSLWTAQQWMSGLTWDPKEFNGLDRFLMPVSQMWTPGIRMGNVVRPPKSITPQHVILMSNGVAVLNEHNRITLACDLSDDACLVYFSSPVYDNDQLALETPDKSPVDLLTGFFVMWTNKGARYQAGAVHATKLNVSLEAFPDTYDVLSFSFGIRDTHAHYRRGPSHVIFKWH